MPQAHRRTMAPIGFLRRLRKNREPVRVRGGSPGRCYRATNVLWPISLERRLLPGKQRRAGAGGELRKLRETARRELGSKPLRRDIDRRLVTPRERDQERSAGFEHTLQLVEERDPVRKRYEVARAVGNGKVSGVSLLESDPLRKLWRRLPPGFGHHVAGEVDADHLRVWEPRCDREGAEAGAGADVERASRDGNGSK